jgi:glycosyltransferase A (GT-A) superfamily protein (DUF2064 family)
MLRHALQIAADARLGPVQLHGAPDAQHPVLRSAAAQAGATCFAQASGNLGERMRLAMAAALRLTPRALLYGTDCPALDAAVLREADAALVDGADCVLVPTADGGFALIGFRREALAAIDDVFDGIAWGSSTVMSSTRDRLPRAGLRWRELATLVDIDEPADLEHVPREWLVQPASGDGAETERK